MKKSVFYTSAEVDLSSTYQFNVPLTEQWADKPYKLSTDLFTIIINAE